MNSSNLRRLMPAAALAALAATASCAGSDSGGTAELSADPTQSETASASATPEPQSEPVSFADGKPFGPGCDRYAREVGFPLWKSKTMPTWLFVLSAESLRDSFGKMEQLGLGGKKKELTYFIPTNRAINALPLDTRGNMVLDDSVARRFFGHHMVGERLRPSDLDGEHRTLSDDILPIEASGKDVSVGAQGASVLCGNIQTETATVYIVDQALMS